MIEVDKLEPGMVVVFHDHKSGRLFRGRILLVEGDGNPSRFWFESRPPSQDTVVYLELDSPVHFMDAPEAISVDHVRPEFMSDDVRQIGSGTYEAMKKAGVSIPPGREGFGRSGFATYILDEPMPMDVVGEFCASHHPNEPLCILQSATLLVAPVRPAQLPGIHGGGYFSEH